MKRKHFVAALITLAIGLLSITGCIDFSSNLPPQAPSDLRVVETYATVVDLAWIDCSNNEHGFKIMRDGIEVAYEPPESTSYSDPYLSCSTTYAYYVAASNDKGEGRSNEIQVTTLGPEYDIQPVIDFASDSQGNIQYNSWAKGNGNWDGGHLASPTIYIGDVITWTIGVSNTDAPLEYKFYFQAAWPGGYILQDWSASNTLTWTVEEWARGGGNPAEAYPFMWLSVRNNDQRNHFSDCDDHTYMTYVIKER